MRQKRALALKQVRTWAYPPGFLQVSCLAPSLLFPSLIPLFLPSFFAFPSVPPPFLPLCLDPGIALGSLETPLPGRLRADSAEFPDSAIQ